MELAAPSRKKKINSYQDLLVWQRSSHSVISFRKRVMAVIELYSLFTAHYSI
jgi:hypothetical protein